MVKSYFLGLILLVSFFVCQPLFAQTGTGNLTIVSSGGDAEGTTWTYSNGVIQTISSTANVLNTTIEAKLNSANLSIEANKVTFSANVTGTTSNSFRVLSKTHILNTTATTITTQGGLVLFASNVDDATDGESTTNGYIQLRYGITINSNGGDITFGGGNTSGSDYALGSSAQDYTEGVRFDAIISLNSGNGNISIKGKSYAMAVPWGWGASGVGFYFFSAATGTITSGTGTITIDGYSQTNTSSYASGFYCMNALVISSANTTANAISITGKATGASGEAWGIESEGILSILATGTGGGITINTSKQLTDNYDVVFRAETNILAVSGPINLKTGQLSGITNGYLYLNGHMYLGSKSGSAVTTSSSSINLQVDRLAYDNGAIPKIGTSGSVTIQPIAVSFGMDIFSSYFNLNQNSQTMSGFTIGKTGNASNIYLNTAITATGPVNVHGATVGITGALTASASDVSLYASTAVTQTQPISSAGLSLNGTGTFTLTNTLNSFSTLAGGTVGSLLGATQVTDVSGGLTIGTVGSNTGLKGSSTILVETLADNLTLTGSISTNSTSTDAVILTAAKNTAIGIGIGGDIIVSGTPTITMGSGGIAKLFSGLESSSTGLTSLAGGSSNVRNNYDETTTTFSPVLSANNRYAIYRTSAGVGSLTIVSSSGDAINTTWTYDNGVINTITNPVNILSSVIENYLTSGPLTINAGNTTINAAISSTSSNAFVLNANSTLSNTTPTTTVNAAITNGGSITINTGTFNVAQNITTTSTAAITISATNQISTSTATRRTISTQGGNITLNADTDANGTGWLDIDDLTLNPGTANLIVRGETFNVNGTESRKPYINGTGSFTFESNDASFGSDIGSAWFVIDQDANGISGLTIGKSGSTANIYLNSSFTVAGPINVYGGYVELTGTITSSGTNDIFLKGIANSNGSVNIGAGGITKIGGTGTLTLQAHGRAINSGTISATGAGVLNVVIWSDFDGDNVGGGSTLNAGSITTNGGHVWLGGSNSNGGSYTWNGLTVGDGPSTGASGCNCNAIDLFSPITTNGGDVLLWASNSSPGCGTSGIQSDGSRHINAGSGDITLIAYQTGGAIELTSTGVISLLPNAGSYSAAFTYGGTLTSGNFTFNTSYYNGLKINSLASSGLVIGSYAGHLNSGVAVVQGNTSNVTISSAIATKSLEIYGGAVALNENLTTSGLNADMLIKATTNINLAASKTIATNAGDVNLWADSDDNSTGYVQLLSSAVINSSGGDINLGGGASLTTDYAFGTTAETCPEATGTQYISGVHMRNGSSLSSNGGNITVRGQNANTANAAMSFGVSLRGVVMTSGTGKISINGVANGSGSVNAQGVASWGTLTIRSANTSSDAISITGNALSSVGTSSLGVNAVALFEATGVGGGIMITGKSGIASTNASVNLGGDILALSGPITISGENASGIQDNIYFGSATIIGKKAATNVTTSSSNVLLEGNVITTPGSLLVDCSGTLTVQPFGNSFASAISWPMTNITHAVGLSGLTIGKQTNTSNVTFSNTTTISGPITAYGGAITVSSPVTAAGNILLDGDTGSFLSQNSKGVSISAAVTTSNNGNITILGRGGSTTGINTHGINVTNLVEAGGTGNIELIGYGGLSSNNSTGSSCHGINIEGSSAWIKSNGGNLALTGFGGGAGAGTYSQGVVLLTNAKASAAGNGTINIAGTGGVNSVIGLRGIVLTTGSSIYSAGGAIQLTGNPGTNGSDNSDGVTIDAASVGSNASGPITITGTAGGGTGSEAITFVNTNTIGGASHANTISLKGNNFSLSGATSILTTGQVFIEPTSTSFSATMQYPMNSMTIANTISGLTIGKTGNLANITIGSATSVNGPITLYGGALTLTGALTTSNTTTGNMSLNGSTLSGSSLAVADGRTLTLNLSSNTTYTGAISGNNLSFVKNGSGILSLTGATALSFADFTISGGTYRLNGNQQLTLTNTLTNNATFTMKDGATFVQGTSGTSVTGTGTFIVEKSLTDNSSTWTTTSGRFWYMGVPMVNLARSSFGTPSTTTNRLWSYSESTKQYTELTSGSALLSAGTGYVHRRTTNDTLTFSAGGVNGLYGSDLNLTNLGRNAGTSAGYHLVSNPYMAYLDWNALTKTNIEPTYYIRTNNTTNSNISALISYNSETNLSTNTSSVTATTQQLRYIAPLQSIWVRVGTAAATGSLGMTRGMLSHQTGNVGLKNSTVFPTLARVNLVDGNNFDQLLVYLNSDMSNDVDQYDSEKMATSGTVQVYTMSSNKKLVMNGLKNNKKKVSVPLYLELPETKSYILQLSEYIVEDGLILLEDKQEGTIQDFTLMENYSFYANSGLLQNRFVLHFILPDAELSTQGPSNSWVQAETSYTEGVDFEILNDDKGNVQITLNHPEDQKVEGTVFVTDMNGKAVYSGQLQGVITAIELDVPSGIYFLTVQSGTLIEMKKVFIQE